MGLGFLAAYYCGCGGVTSFWMVGRGGFLVRRDDLAMLGWTCWYLDGCACVLELLVLGLFW